MFSTPTFLVIVGLFLLAETFQWPEWLTATIASVIALVYIAIIVRSVKQSGRGAALLNRNMWLIYIAYIAILWNLWFFSFWSVQIVREAAESSLLAAALTAAFNAGAGILGFPVGGWLADRAVRSGRGRKPLALVCTAVYSVLVLLFGWSISGGEGDQLPSPINCPSKATLSSGHVTVSRGSGRRRAVASRSPGARSATRRQPPQARSLWSPVARTFRPLARRTLKTCRRPTCQTLSLRAAA